MTIPTSISFMMAIKWKPNMSIENYFDRFYSIGRNVKETVNLIIGLDYNIVAICSLQLKQTMRIEKWLHDVLNGKTTKGSILKQLNEMINKQAKEIHDLSNYLLKEVDILQATDELVRYIDNLLHDNMENQYAVIKQYQIKVTVDLLLIEMKLNKSKCEWYTRVIREEQVKKIINSKYKK